MKNIKKWLALMLAGMMIATSLAACNSSDASDDEDEDEEQSEKADKDDKDDKDDTDKDDTDKDDTDKDDTDKDDTDKDDTDKDDDETNGLSPEEVWKKIVDEDDVTVEFEYDYNYDGEETETTDCYEKDGDKVKNGYVYDGEAGTNYIDLAEGLEYFELEGEWYTDECYYSGWEDMLDGMFGGMEFLFEDDNYDSAGEVYTVTDRAIENFLDQYSADLEAILGEGDIKVDAGMKMQSADKYIFHINMSSEDGEYNIEFTVAFKSVSIALPEATVEDDVDDDDDDVFIDLPEVPTVLPSQLYDAILNEDEMNIEVWILEGEDGVSYDFTKSGNRLSLDYWDGDDTTTVYYDFDEEVCYYYDENYDLCSEPFEEELTWESTVDEINDLVYGILSIDDDEVVLDSFWGYVASDDLCEEYGFDSVLYTCDDSSSTYGYDVFTEDFENSYEITVSFEDVSLDFPTV